MRKSLATVFDLTFYLQQELNFEEKDQVSSKFLIHFNTWLQFSAILLISQIIVIYSNDSKTIVLPLRKEEKIMKNVLFLSPSQYPSHYRYAAILFKKQRYVSGQHKVNLKIICKENYKYEVQEKSPANQAVTVQQLAEEYWR